MCQGPSGPDSGRRSPSVPENKSHGLTPCLPSKHKDAGSGEGGFIM